MYQEGKSMQEYLVIHPSDWRYRPTAAQVEACVSLLKS